MIITLHKDFLVNELGLPDNAIHEELVDTHKGDEIYSIVFGYDGKFYQTELRRSEHYDVWEYEGEIDCIEVEYKEVLVKKWVRKEG